MDTKLTMQHVQPREDYPSAQEPFQIREVLTIF